LKQSPTEKILVIAESIDIEDSSGSKANVALIKNLKRAGFEVLVYHYTRKIINLDSIPCIAIKENRRSLLFYLSRLQRKLQHIFHWNLSKYLEPGIGFSFTFLNDSKSIRKSIRSMKNFEPDLVLTLSKGASFRPHHALLELPEYYDKWMAYIHDPYPFHLYPEPYSWSEPGYQKKVNFFNQVSIKCRWAVFPSLLLAEWMQKPFPQFKGKSIIIPHQISDDEKKNKLKFPEYFDLSKFNLLHAGNLMKQRNPSSLIEAFQIFMERHPDAVNDSRLLFLGNYSFYKNQLNQKENLIKQLYVSDGYVEYESVLQMQHLSSVNIILESVSDISPFLPGKFPHCVEANKPILHLGPSKSEVRRLLGEKYEFATEANDIKNIVKILEILYHNWKIDSKILKLNRPDLENYLSVDYLKKQIERCL
tara:strand:- start:2150 stop:3409 length:1260 start_codon:yes stop_codon:yes gene_type:complete